MNEIKLNDLLRLNDVSKIKIRLNLTNKNWNGLAHYHQDPHLLLLGNFHNSPSKKYFKENDIVIGLLQIKASEWLLIDISLITKSYNKFWDRSPATINTFYEREVLEEFRKYFGRLVLRFHKNGSYVTLKGNRIDDFIVHEILPASFSNNSFPGYDKVDVSWNQLNTLLQTEKTWISNLQNQKGVYLLTDISNGKKYVGSAYGEHMILGRWLGYLKNGHGGNAKLRALPIEYMKENFRFSILEIFKSTTDDDTILKRESWWKSVLLSRGDFGYNDN